MLSVFLFALTLSLSLHITVRLRILARICHSICALKVRNAKLMNQLKSASHSVSRLVSESIDRLVGRSVISLSISLSVWLLLFLVDCLYLNGSSYHGNISVTASGIPCQSWTEQCPHRHTMNNTYPELHNAKNYCRNPQNSGQRPWCFTTDRNKRWEYCDIPKCIPGIE